MLGREYCWNDALLYHQMGGVIMEVGESIEQLILSKFSRATVLRVAHSISSAGYCLKK